MPELPEVEIVRRGMEDAVLGKAIKAVVINRYDLRVPLPQDFGQTVTGKTFTALMRRGKYIIMQMDADVFAVLHLGMSGRMRIFAPETPYIPRKHDHVVFTMDDGTCLAFEDPRRFGMLYITANDWGSEKPFVSMGPEPLENWSGRALYETLRRKKSPIKSALLDQHVVSGLGNIYVCEALFRAGIHPERLSNAVTVPEADKIVACARAVLEEAIEAGGSTLKDYQHTDGSLGYFQHKFSVYDQVGEKCHTKGCSLKIVRMVQAGRSTFYCPGCQK